MCTVVGYIGKSFCSTFIFEGLARLEYRGYDSAGFACLDSVNQKLVYCKSSGQLFRLAEHVKKNPIDGFLGIGHTRWSTHGDTSQENAHPHFDCSQTISVVHNGIIENYGVLKQEMKNMGHVFYSETDTEVISHLFEQLLLSSSVTPQDVSRIVQILHGSYAFIVMLQAFPDMLIAIRKKSPLCIGIGADETFIASDVIAFSDKTDAVFFLPDESFVFVFRNEVRVYDFMGNQLPVMVQKVAAVFKHADKGEHGHFMLKEMYEQKNAIISTVHSIRALQRSGLWNQLGVTGNHVRSMIHIYLIACGTSWHAARMAQFFFEAISSVPVTVCLASEFRHAVFFAQKDAIYIFISQSGETADTLEALRLINAHDGLCAIALTNVMSSTIVREAQGFLATDAGPEIAVASTKAFSTQLTALYLLAHYIGFEKNIVTAQELVQAENDLLSIASILQESLEQHKQSIDRIYAQRYACYDKALFLGRHISYPLAMEAALKLKEIAYVFAESYPAGELKHGPLALVDSSMPVFIFSHQDETIYQKLLSNAYEVKARGGRVIAFAYSGQTQLCALAEASFIISSDIPPLLGPLAMIGLIQYFVYAVAKERGCSIDKPRNLAKSVTVE
jgi:glucosamine--fructose-6-phosphate aminotransferase (isomerizing)